jgi:hypothetical protein
VSAQTAAVLGILGTVLLLVVLTSIAVTLAGIRRALEKSVGIERPEHRMPGAQ